MRTLGLVAQKGGSGKTTLAAHMAFCAAAQHRKVALLDLDPQASLYDWNESRKPDRAFDAAQAGARDLAALLDQAAAAGVEMAIVDTAPHAAAEAAIVIALCDLVLVPCRPARFDLRAVARTLAMVATAGVAHVVVINGAPPRSSRLVAEARAALVELGANVLPDIVHQRAALAHAVIDGSAVHEFAPASPAALEIAALYNHITRFYG